MSIKKNNNNQKRGTDSQKIEMGEGIKSETGEAGKKPATRIDEKNKNKTIERGDDKENETNKQQRKKEIEKKIGEICKMLKDIDANPKGYGEDIKNLKEKLLGERGDLINLSKSLFKSKKTKDPGKEIKEQIERAKIKSKIESSLEKKYPSFYYKQLLITDGRIILLDEPLKEQVQEKLKSLKTSDGYELLFLKDLQLATGLEEILLKIIRQDCTPLLVFPGRGSNYPRNLSQICQEFSGINVDAKRFWKPGSIPVVTAGEIVLPDGFLATNVETIVVVDDVISSGLTMQKIRENNAWKFPKAEWFGASWVAQIPRTKAKSGISGYEGVGAACVVGKRNGERVPINSISTLRQDRKIAKSYAERHFLNSDEFLYLHRLVTIGDTLQFFENTAVLT